MAASSGTTAESRAGGVVLPAALLGALLATMVLALAAATAEAKVGSLDPSFGEGGRVARSIDFAESAWETAPVETAEAPNGRVFVLLASQKTLLGFEPDGRTDRGFGVNGTVRIAAPEGTTLQPTGMVVDRQGRILVAGTLEIGNEPPYQVPGPLPESVMVVRYTQDGQPDPTFGQGGVAVNRFGFEPMTLGDYFVGLRPGPIQVRSSGIALDSTGRILLSGNHRLFESCQRSASTKSESFVARLGSSGQPDPGFGDSGVVELRSGLAGALTADEEGGLFVFAANNHPDCSAVLTGISPPPFLVHLDAEGNGVPGFGTGGWRRAPEDPEMKLVADGRGGLLILGSRNVLDPNTIKRLRPNGALDPRFGHKGVVSLLARINVFELTDIAVDQAQRILVSGIWRRPSQGTGAKRRFLLVRLSRRGEIDRRLGPLRTGFGRRTRAIARSLLIDRRGRPLLAGTLRSPALAAGEGLAMARYLPGR